VSRRDGEAQGGLPRHGIRLWCSNCATPATFILPHVILAPGSLFRTRSLSPCGRCGSVDFQNEKRVILTSADRRFLRSMRIAPSWAETVTS
jgi:ribosomal protein S27AE